MKADSHPLNFDNRHTRPKLENVDELKNLDIKMTLT